MLTHPLKLLVLASALLVVPASVGQLAMASAAPHSWSCPDQERARLAAVGYQAIPTATQSDTAGSSLFDIGRRSAFLAP
jgi:hypothetical protein